MSPAKKPKAQVKSTWLKIRVTEDRLQRWKDWAARAKTLEDDDDLDFSAWVRRALNRAVHAEEPAADEPSEKKGRGGNGGRT